MEVPALPSGAGSHPTWIVAGPDGKAKDILVGLHFAGESANDPDEHGIGPDFTVAVNLSTHSLLDDCFATEVSVALDRAVSFWTEWSSHVGTHKRHEQAVLRSLLVLRALTHRGTGGIVVPSGNRPRVPSLMMMAPGPATSSAKVSSGALTEPACWTGGPFRS